MSIVLQQVSMLLMGVFCVGFGGLLLGYEIHRRLRGVRVTGTIIGVREEKPGMYRNVYRYMLPSGGMHEGTSDVGSNSTSGRQTGRSVELLVLADHPERASEAGSFITGAFGAIILLPGLWLLYTALTAWPVTPFVWLVLAGCVVYLALHIRKFLVSASLRKSFRARRLAELQAVPVRPIEEVVAKPAAPDVKTHRFSRPLLILAGLAILGVAIYVGHRTAQLSATGERASGRVVQVRAESDSDGTTYRPIVRFEAAGETVEFRDRVGSNPPSHRVGEAVTVLYRKSSPEKSAIIDRGLWNWLPALLIGVFGAGLFWIGLRLGAATPLK